MQLKFFIYFWILFLFVEFSEVYSEECSDRILGEQTQFLSLQEAIEKNLLQQPSIQISLQNVEIQKGVAQSSAAPFDPVLTSEVRRIRSRNLLSIGQNPLLDDFVNENPFACDAFHTDQSATETTGHLDVTTKTREGTQFLFSLDLDQNNNPLNCPRRLNTGKVEIGVNQPILRDFQNGIERMTELASLREVDAVLFDTLQFISDQVFKTTLAYWDVVAARKNLEAQKESEKRLTELVNNVKFLIEHQQLAGTDILQPLAQLSSQTVRRISAEQQYYQALQLLKFAIGEWNENCPCEDNLFEAWDEFPLVELNAEELPSIFCKLFPQVYSQRFDILASINREDVFRLLLKGAKNLELPRLDVYGKVSWTDARAGSRYSPFFSSLSMEHPQEDITVGIIFSTPFFRDEAKGLMRQRQAQWTQTMANTQLLKQQALSDVTIALQNQLNLYGEIIKAQQAVEEYSDLLRNETKKLVAGYSTLFILLNFESSLVNAISTLIQLQSQAAKNIATIRFLTGTLIRYSPTQECRFFSVENPAQLPFGIKTYLPDIKNRSLNAHQPAVNNG